MGHETTVKVVGGAACSLLEGGGCHRQGVLLFIVLLVAARVGAWLLLFVLAFWSENDPKQRLSLKYPRNDRGPTLYVLFTGKI